MSRIGLSAYKMIVLPDNGLGLHSFITVMLGCQIRYRYISLVTYLAVAL
jgi:hypothetical protein